MTTIRRIKNDIATMDKREKADKRVMDDRDGNDVITMNRRAKADKTIEKSRLRNDEITANRREIKDKDKNMAFLAVFLLILIGLAVGAYFVFI